MALQRINNLTVKMLCDFNLFVHDIMGNLFYFVKYRDWKKTCEFCFGMIFFQ